MPSSFVRTFADRDELTEAVRVAAVEFTVTEREINVARLTVIHLDNVWLQDLPTDLARSFHIEFLDLLANITVQTKPGSSQVRNGIEYDLNDISRSDRGHRDRSSGPASTGALKLPLNELASLGGALLGHLLPPLSDAQTITPPANEMARLWLYEGALIVAEDGPAVLAHPEGARSLEQALIEAMMHCLGGGEARLDRAVQRQHAAVMRGFQGVVEERLDEPLYIPVLCREIGASERTLLACCQEHLGMGPKRFLLMRRMHTVRRALRESTPAETKLLIWRRGTASGNSAGLLTNTRRCSGKRHRPRSRGHRSVPCAGDRAPARGFGHVAGLPVLRVGQGCGGTAL